MKRFNAIDAEMTEGTTKFAPGNDQTHAFKYRDRAGPYHPFRGPGMLISIAQANAAFLAHGLPQSQVQEIISGGPGAGTDQHRGTGKVFRPFLGYHRSDFREDLASRRLEGAISAIRHPSHAKHQGLKFVRGQHQRRQRESWHQAVTDSRFTRDIRALTLQRDDVPVEGT
jgi:hypothetical protein